MLFWKFSIASAEGDQPLLGELCSDLWQSALVDKCTRLGFSTRIGLNFILFDSFTNSVISGSGLLGHSVPPSVKQGFRGDAKIKN